MHHAVAVAEIVKHMGHMLVLGTGKHIDVDANLAEETGQFTDVNIHTACVFATQGGQRTGMIGNHGNIKHFHLTRKKGLV